MQPDFMSVTDRAGRYGPDGPHTLHTKKVEPGRRQTMTGSAHRNGLSNGEAKSVNEAMKEPEGDAPRRIKGQTLRLPPAERLKMRILAAVLDDKCSGRVTQHDLLLEAVDDVLAKYHEKLSGNDA